MARNSKRERISQADVYVYWVLSSTARWLTNREIAELAPGEIADRTVRLATQRLVKAGMVESIEIAPAPRFRWIERHQNAALADQLERAAGALRVRDRVRSTSESFRASDEGSTAGGIGQRVGTDTEVSADDAALLARMQELRARTRRGTVSAADILDELRDERDADILDAISRAQ